MENQLMSKTNWREFFEEYRTGELSEDKEAAMKSAIESDEDLRAEYELFFAIQEGLDNERIRNKLSSIRKNPGRNKGKNFTGFNSILWAFVAAGLCFFAYRVVMDRSVETSDAEEMNMQEATPAQIPADTSTRQEEQPAPERKTQDKVQTNVQPYRNTPERPMASATSGIVSEQLVSKYLSETEITKPLMRSGGQTDSSMAERATSYLKSGQYAATINLLTAMGESEGIHPDDKLWFLSLAYLGDGNLVQTKKSLEEIANDDFNTHHKMATQLLAEIEILK